VFIDCEYGACYAASFPYFSGANEAALGLPWLQIRDRSVTGTAGVTLDCTKSAAFELICFGTPSMIPKSGSRFSDKIMLKRKM
jgi:hypothetical protein